MKRNENLKSYPGGDSTAARLEGTLKELKVDELARQSGFCRRRPRKLWPLRFIQCCFLILLPDRASLRSWAILIGLLENLTYSKQAVFKRLNSAALLLRRLGRGGPGVAA